MTVAHPAFPPPTVGYGLPALSWRNLTLVVMAHGLMLVAIAPLSPARVPRDETARTVDLIALPAHTAPAATPVPAKSIEQRPQPQTRPLPHPRSPILVSEAATSAAETTPPAPLTPPPAAAAAPANPGPAITSQPRFDADYLHNPAPAYPPLSRRLAEEGRVTLRVFVEPGGRAAQVEIKAGSGYPRLDQAAAEAVARWQFVPARRGDEAVGAWVLVPIIFSLKG